MEWIDENDEEENSESDYDEESEPEQTTVVTEKPKVRKKLKARLPADFSHETRNERLETYKLSREEAAMLKKLKERQARDRQEPETFVVKKHTTLEYLSDNCVLNNFKLRLYHHVFDKTSGDAGGVLTPQQLVRALRRVNKNLIGKDELKYIFLVLDIVTETGKHAHIDFKMFAAVAALSERIAPMEKLIKQFSDSADFASLKSKVEFSNELFLGLFKNQLDDVSAGIPLDDLAVELRAGNVSDENIDEILDTLRQNQMDPMTFLDYLAYIPLFCDLHEQALAAPLRMERGES